jgi:hypothetical protein
MPHKKTFFIVTGELNLCWAVSRVVVYFNQIISSILKTRQIWLHRKTLGFMLYYLSRQPPENVTKFLCGFFLDSQACFSIIFAWKSGFLSIILYQEKLKMLFRQDFFGVCIIGLNHYKGD